MDVNKCFPLYAQLVASDIKGYSEAELIKKIHDISTRDEREVFQILYLLMLCHSKLKTDKVWGDKKAGIPCQGKSMTAGNVTFNIENVPEDLKIIMFKFLKKIEV